MTTVLSRISRAETVRIGDVELTVAEGVHHPAPLFGISVAPLQDAAVARLADTSRVLELGTGAGYWALSAARRGHDVTATDLPEVPLEPIQAAAAKLGVKVRTLASDLFAALPDERFDAVLFNPPFHDAEPRTAEERAWCGRSVMQRLFDELPAHLTATGSGWILLPRAEQERYAAPLARYRVEPHAAQWFPILGTVELLQLTPESSATGSSRPATGR
jgi:methylase of polypeptide subunit release factors